MIDFSRYHLIPETTRMTIDLYVKERIPTGDFLYAVLSNNLMEAVGRADERNLAALPIICSYIYNEIPLGCHGSPEKVKKWLEKD